MWKETGLKIAGRAMRSLLMSTVMAGFLVAAMGCGKDYTGYFSGKELSELFSVIDVSNQTPNESQKAKVDFLFVVDNSGSMRNDQEALAANIGKFSQILPNLDLCYAVTTTDAWRKRKHAISKGRKACRNPKDVDAVSEETFLEEFRKDILVGTRGHGSERVGQSIFQWLKKNEGYNFKNKKYRPRVKRQILRPNALWVVVLISDEPFQLPRVKGKNMRQIRKRARAKSRLYGPKAVVQMLKEYQQVRNQNETNQLFFTSVFDTRRENFYSRRNLPKRYRKLIRRHYHRRGIVLNGYNKLAKAAGEQSKKFDIRKDDYSAIVDEGMINVVEKHVSIASEIRTSHPIRPNSVRLNILDAGGNKVMSVPEGHYSYDTNQNGSTVFVDQNWLRSLMEQDNTASGWMIQIVYSPLSLG